MTGTFLVGVLRDRSFPFSAVASSCSDVVDPGLASATLIAWRLHDPKRPTPGVSRLDSTDSCFARSGGGWWFETRGDDDRLCEGTSNRRTHATAGSGWRG